MTVTTDRPARTSQAAPPRRRRGHFGGSLLHAYTWLIVAWLVAPIGVMVVFGFNNPKGRYNQTWQGFTLKWYQQLFSIPDLTSALVRSLLMAVAATLVALVAAAGTSVGAPYRVTHSPSGTTTSPSSQRPPSCTGDVTDRSTSGASSSPESMGDRLASNCGKSPTASRMSSSISSYVTSSERDNTSRSKGRRASAY